MQFRWVLPIRQVCSISLGSLLSKNLCSSKTSHLGARLALSLSGPPLEYFYSKVIFARCSADLFNWSPPSVRSCLACLFAWDGMLGVASSLFTLGVILVTSAFSLYLLLRGARSLGYILFYPSFPAWLSCQPAFSLPHSSPPRCSWSFASLFYLLCLPGGAVLLLVLLACCFVCSCRFSCCGALFFIERKTILQCFQNWVINELSEKPLV